jgi:hypothetical protein
MRRIKGGAERAKRAHLELIRAERAQGDAMAGASCELAIGTDPFFINTEIQNQWMKISVREYNETEVNNRMQLNEYSDYPMLEDTQKYIDSELIQDSGCALLPKKVMIYMVRWLENNLPQKEKYTLMENLFKSRTLPCKACVKFLTGVADPDYIYSGNSTGPKKVFPKRSDYISVNERRVSPLLPQNTVVPDGFDWRELPASKPHIDMWKIFETAVYAWIVGKDSQWTDSSIKYLGNGITIDLTDLNTPMKEAQGLAASMIWAPDDVSWWSAKRPDGRYYKDQ